MKRSNCSKGIKLFPLTICGMGLLIHSGSIAQAAITCTAAPDCASLGYTKSASQCPDGGMKCPFDSSKMFCVAAENLDFVFKNKISVGHIVYSDGTTSSSYTSTKLPIGIVIYVHPNGKQNHGLVLSLEDAMPRTRAEAILYCNNYVTAGTKVGDWHLSDLGETAIFSDNNPDSYYSTMEDYLYKIPWVNGIVSVYGYAMSVYSAMASTSKHDYVGTIGSYYHHSYYPWTSTDQYGSSNMVRMNLDNNSISLATSSSTSSYYNNFRCVAQF